MKTPIFTNVIRGTALTAIQLAIGMLANTAHATDIGDMISVSGFGTVGAAHSSSTQGDYVSSYNQTAGAGASTAWSFGPDTKLGFQLNGKFTDQFSAVLQIIAQDQTNNTFSPRVEWANLQYAITPDLKVRVGRTALPTFMVSDTRLVGYSNPWILPPLETYNLYTITNADGADATYKLHFGDVTDTAQVLYGKTSIDAYGGNGTVLRGLKAKQIEGINDTVEYGSLTARIGFTRSNLELSEFGFAIKSATQVINIGATYDPGTWFIQGEISKSALPNLTTDEKAFYVTGGYRVKNFTPYATYSQAKPTGAGTPGDDAKTASLGIRWDAMKNIDVKLQFDRMSLGKESVGYFTNVQPGLAGSKFNIVNVAVDYVF